MHSKTKLCLIGLTLTLLLTSTVAVLAQNSTGEIDGTVKDSSGAVISGAVVKIFNSETGQLVRTVKTNVKGDYSIPQLDVGTYQINVSSSGFKTADITNIDLHIADTLSMNATLTTGETSTDVTVTANNAAPATETAENASVIDNQQMNELSLSTRNFEQMALLEPGVSYNTGAGNGMPGTVDSTGRSTNGHGLSINGMRPQQLGWTMDGSDILNHGDNLQVSIFPSLTAIREMKILRNTYGAQYGGGGSAQVMVSTQAGGSKITGNLFFFDRPAPLAAIPYSNQAVKTRPPTIYTDFGWALSGPVFIPGIYPRAKSKTFFFYSNELRRNTLYPTQNINDYPTMAQANGYFSSPVCAQFVFVPGQTKTSGTCPKNRAPLDPNPLYPGYPYYILGPGSPLTQIDPVAQAYLKDEILPALGLQQGNTPIAQQLSQQVASPMSETQTLVRIDHQFSERFSVFFRYIRDPIHQDIVCGIYANANSCMPGVAESHVAQVGSSMALHGTWVMTPTTVVEMGASFNPYDVRSTPYGTAMAANSPDIQVNLPFLSTTNRVPGIAISTGVWDTVGPFVNHNNTLQIFENTTKQLHQHLLYFGVNFERYTGIVNDGTDNAGLITYNQGGSVNQGVSNFEQNFASFLAGQPSSFVQKSVDPYARPAMDLWEAYVQDDWRILPRLTLNAGLRYAIYSQVTDRGGHLGGFQPEMYNPTLAPTISTLGSSICTNTTDTGCAGLTPNPNYNPLNGIVQGGINSPYGKMVSTTPLLDFAPRIGFAWNVYGDGTVSLRGGYGIFYNQTTLQMVKTQIFGNPAYVQEPVWNAMPISPENPGGGSSPGSTILTSHGQVRQWTMPYTQSWSLGVQTQIDKDTLLEVGYVGNTTQHLQGEEDLNQPLPGAFLAAGIAPLPATSGSNPNAGLGSAQEAYVNLIRPYQGWGALEYISNRYFANYNGLQTSIRRKLGKNSTLSVNYTWSKTMTNSGDANEATDPQNRFDLKSEWGPAYKMDRRQIVTSNFIYNLPYYRKQQGFIGKALGGWGFSGIVYIVSGLWDTVTESNLDSAGQGILVSNAQGRADMIGDPNHNAPHTNAQWFNTNAFEYVPAGLFRPANEKPGSVLLPGYQEWDLSLVKNFDFKEKQRIELRFEGFNAPNHVNPTGVTMGLGQSGYGAVSSWQNMRVIQLGAKYYF
jgi:hypothetical protein